MIIKKTYELIPQGLLLLDPVIHVALVETGVEVFQLLLGVPLLGRVLFENDGLLEGILIFQRMRILDQFVSN